MNNKKGILILGGSGFIGTNLIIGLLRKKFKYAYDYHIRIYDLNNIKIPIRSFENTDMIKISDPYSDFLNNKELSQIGLEILNRNFKKEENWDYLLEDIDYVVHLIHSPVPEESFKTSDNVNNNLIHSTNLFKSAVENKVKKIIFLSTGGKIYGNRDNHTPIKEHEKINPIYSYERAKLKIERALDSITYRSETRYIIFRPSNPYGENYFYTNRPLGLINVALQKLKKDDTLTIWGDGSNIRDYIYIEDLVEAIIRGILSNNDKSLLLNVGTGIGKSINKIISLIQSITGKNLKVVYTNSRDIDINYNVLNIDAIQNSLNWRPKVNLVEGIEKTWHWLNYIN